MIGDLATHERLVRDLVAGSGTAAMFVHYDRAPETRYPVAIHPAYAATRWVAEHGGEIGVGARLAVVGNGAGGNIAAVVSLMAKDRGTPNVAFQLLLWPVTSADFDTASCGDFADGYFYLLKRAMMQWFWDCYISDPHERARRLCLVAPRVRRNG